MKMRNLIAISSVVFAAYAANAQELVPAREHTDLAGIDRAWSENWNALLDSGEALPFAPPPMESIPDGDFGDMVRNGLSAFMSPATYAEAYVGNALSCSNCHLDAGRKAGGALIRSIFCIGAKISRLIQWRCGFRAVFATR